MKRRPKKPARRVPTKTLPSPPPRQDAGRIRRIAALEEALAFCRQMSSETRLRSNAIEQVCGVLSTELVALKEENHR